MYSTIGRPRGGGSFAFSSLGPSLSREEKERFPFFREFYAISLNASSLEFRGSSPDRRTEIGILRCRGLFSGCRRNEGLMMTSAQILDYTRV